MRATIGASGLPIRASSSAARNRVREGSTRASIARISRSPNGRLIGRLDIGAGVIDQMHVMDAGGAGRHAGEAGEAAVDMLDDFGRRRAVVLQHVLDEIDAAARAVEFVAEQQIGRAGRGAEAAMDAGADDLFRRPHMRIGEQGGGEIGLHGSYPRVHAPGIEHAVGVEARLDAPGDPHQRRGKRLEHIDRFAQFVGRANQRRMAAERRQRGAYRGGGRREASLLSQTRPPPQS